MDIENLNKVDALVSLHEDALIKLYELNELERYIEDEYLRKEALVVEKSMDNLVFIVREKYFKWSSWVTKNKNIYNNNIKYYELKIKTLISEG